MPLHRSIARKRFGRRSGINAALRWRCGVSRAAFIGVHPWFTTHHASRITLPASALYPPRFSRELSL
jgi:hypothetical protein